VDDAGLEEFALRSLEFEPADVGHGDRVLSIAAAPAEERDGYDEQPELHDERLASGIRAKTVFAVLCQSEQVQYVTL
jgi:hypothetical protein